MKSTAHHDDRIAKMTFGTVYPLYLTKIQKKGRTEEELLCIIQWLTGFNPQEISQKIKRKESFESFFENATLPPTVHLITGNICGYRVEDIENRLTQKVRYLDKLVDELAKGRKMEKILRMI